MVHQGMLRWKRTPALMVRRCLKAWLLLVSLAMCAGADEGCLVELGCSRPVCFSYKSSRDSGFTKLNQKPQERLSARIPLGECWLRAEADAGIFKWQGEVRQGVRSGLILDIPLERRLHPVRVGLTLAMVTLPLAWVVYRRRRDQAEWKRLQAEPLVRSDGQVPRRPIGGYTPISVLGSGAMGVVYLASNARGEQAAIKVPMPHLLADPDFRKRFLREIEVGLRLSHPSLVRILALPLEQEPYLLMEYLDGVTLDQVELLPLNQELKRCKGWLEQLLDGLAYIHAQGVIHRDLKPSNLIVSRDLKRIKIMDFGVAHKSEGTRLTATGSVLGTPNFMAPEQIQGQPCDASIDLYALGIILYERISGRPAFPPDFMEMLRHKLQGPLPPLQTHRPEISERWDRFILSLCHFQASERPTARQALAQLSSLSA